MGAYSWTRENKLSFFNSIYTLCRNQLSPNFQPIVTHYHPSIRILSSWRSGRAICRTLCTLRWANGSSCQPPATTRGNPARRMRGAVGGRAGGFPRFSLSSHDENLNQHWLGKKKTKIRFSSQNPDFWVNKHLAQRMRAGDFQRFFHFSHDDKILRISTNIEWKWPKKVESFIF